MSTQEQTGKSARSRRGSNGFLYIAGFTPEEAEVAALELWAMTGAELDGRTASSLTACDISASAYTRLCMEVSAQQDDLQALISRVADLSLTAEGFAVDVQRLPPKPDLRSEDVARRIADVITGRPNLSRPREVFVLLAQRGWYAFGRSVSRARRDWHDAAKRPFHFSNSLPVRLSRALVNMVVAPGDTFVDPCCGVGTVLIEADRVGARALGLDISLSRVAMAQANLRYFGCRATVEQGDARELKGAFDAAVIDLPYGRTTNASDALYTEIVGRVSQCVERLVVVTGENKEYLWAQMGLKVRGAAKIRATNLVRHIYLMWGKR